MSGSVLAQWLLEKGGLISNCVSIQEQSAKGRCLKASRDVEASELLLRVPLSVMIRPDLGLQILRERGASLPEENSDEVLLTVYVAECISKTEGLHGPYFSALPSLDDYMRVHPLFWSASSFCAGCEAYEHVTTMFDLDVESTHVLQKEIENLQAAVETHRNKLSTRCGQTKYAQAHFQHAWAVVTSRGFLLRQPRQADVVLIPLADLMNHGGKGAGGANVRWKYNAAADAADFRTIRPVRQGSEFLLNYSAAESGRHPMHQEKPFHFLLCYGFLEASDVCLKSTQATECADAMTSKDSSVLEGSDAERWERNNAAILIQSRLRCKRSQRTILA